MQTPALPSDETRFLTVNSFQELAETPFANGINAFCWQRELQGDFAEVVRHLGQGQGIVELDECLLRKLPVSPLGRQAIDVMLDDLRRLRELDLEPQLNAIFEYQRDETGRPVSTDVFSFHVDSAPVETDTWLCAYFGAPSEGLPNADARRRIDDPTTRAELLRLFGGRDDATFRQYLRDNHFDLHYAATPGAKPFPFGVGNLWRLAVEWPKSPVLPCIHRAPTPQPGDPPRLLLIS